MIKTMKSSQIRIWCDKCINGARRTEDENLLVIQAAPGNSESNYIVEVISPEDYEKEIPASKADVVRCKDCNAYTPTGPGTGVCPALGGVAEYDGCTMGDRREKNIKHVNLEIQWIDANKRLPENERTVLIVERFKGSNGEHMQEIKTGQYCRYSGENKEWVYFANMKGAKITHWAELPQVIKEAGDFT